ncbi:putative aspartic-type endopeptidase opsB [Golovinomyces cichoracearum]|uniref:Probable aspartic-type endopeptidase OPSB n=1 Tax=Golovinomyces cichoracearum TaxID=62708 RepID=A0A420I0Z4_9PEZI|nr:putative aspartic-type endopeptidase opsB [Golovinomyces cichoracearum]
MKGSKIFVLSTFLVAIEGSIIGEITKKPQVVEFPFEKSRRISGPVSRDRLRRRGEVLAYLDNHDTLYFFNVTVGTPPQKLRLHLDTGSSDLWVNTPKSRLCSQESRPCRETGAYSANSSSTYKFVASNFNISYVDGSGAEGDYVNDDVMIGTTKIKNLQFGVGYSSSSSQGILGIGYSINEVQVGRAQRKPYPNLPMRMVKDGLIKSNAYSLWLNDLDASTGSILFGGIDTAQYVGPLKTVPIQKIGGVHSEFLITMTGLSIGNKVISNDMAQAVLLDSGSSLTYLPDYIVKYIYELLDAKYDASEQAAYVPCSYAKSSITLNFTFSEPVITVDMSELVIPISNSRSQQDDETSACLFGIAPAGTGSSVLGDTFIRSAYLVFDLDNNRISMAQTNFNATEHNIVEIGTGEKSVPDAIIVPNPVSAKYGIDPSSAESAGATPIVPLLPRESFLWILFSVTFAYSIFL